MKERKQAETAFRVVQCFHANQNATSPMVNAIDALLNYVKAVDDALNDATANGSFY